MLFKSCFLSHFFFKGKTIFSKVGFLKKKKSFCFDEIASFFFTRL